ncbi:VWA domain-containing protein [Sphaerisporangium sp. B11E5]|uniref:vWA domain-containing protein n=1 Tax=Sphaerisporangium sp. B11E5 TaxID=3153563 RepID=UPI00325C6E70
MDATTLSLLPERPVVRDDAISEVDLVVEVSCQSAETREEPAGPMNLCLVIDRSGSMSGDKLDTAKASCANIFRRLGANDQLTVVTFDDVAEVIVNPQTPRDQVTQRISAIFARGMTNLSLGWYQGLLELQTHVGTTHYSRLFLLSDGQANRGESKRAVFADTAAKARDVGITASTIGIGADYQEDLLEAIASASGGRFWNISEADIEDIIEEEFKGALTVLLDRPRVTLSLPDGVRVSRELNNLQKVGGQRYQLRPLQGNDIFNFALRVEIDPERFPAREFTLTCTLHDGQREICSTTTQLTFGSSDEVAASPVHPLVRSTIEQFEVTTADETMLAEMEAGNITKLRQMLTAEIARMQPLQQTWRNMHDADEADQWGIGHTRAGWEVMNIRHHYRSKSVLGEIIAMIEPYADEPEVRLYLSMARKNAMREGQRMKSRRLEPLQWDAETPLILEAIALADTLIAKHPDDHVRLEEFRERLREHLENS